MSYPLKFNVIRTEALMLPNSGGKFGPHARGSRAHAGWDLKAKIGTPVHAVGPGTISLVGRDVSGYGTIVQLRFLRGWTYYWALYAHLADVVVRPGQSIAEGTVLGYTGNTGNARGQPPHLHFEVATDSSLRKGRTNQVDPAGILGDFLRDNPSGTAIVVERSYPDPTVTIEDLELAERAGRTA